MYLISWLIQIHLKMSKELEIITGICYAHPVNDDQ